VGLNSSSAMIRAADAARAAYSVNVPILAPTSRMIESSEFYGIGRREEYGPEGGEIEEGFQPDLAAIAKRNRVREPKGAQSDVRQGERNRSGAFLGSEGSQACLLPAPTFWSSGRS
jgi:hypothetical protein